MAKKNSIGPTANKKASLYTATAPDGSILKKRSFFIHTDNALMGAFYHNGKWIATGILGEAGEYALNKQFLNAKKIK